MLRVGSTVRNIWTGFATVAMIVAVGVGIYKLDWSAAQSDFNFRGDSHAALVSILETPKVKQAMRCGPISVPNHKLVPDVRWITGKPANQVIARGQAVWPGGGESRAAIRKRLQGGVAIYALGGDTLLRQAFTDLESLDSPLIQVPNPNFQRVAFNDYYSAYGRC